MIRFRLLLAPARAAVVLAAGLVVAGCHASGRRPAQATRGGRDPVWMASAAVPTAEQALPAAPKAVDDRAWPTPLNAAGIVRINGGFALIASGQQRACDGCRGVIVTTYFRRAAGRWAVAGQWTDHNALSGLVSVQPIAAPAGVPIIAINQSTVYAGASAAWTDIIELAPQRPIARARIPLNSDDDIFGDRPDRRAKITATLSVMNDPFGVAIRYRGHLCRQRFIDRIVHYAARRPDGDWTPDAPPPDRACPADLRWPFPPPDEAAALIPSRLQVENWAKHLKPGPVIPIGRGFALLMTGYDFDCSGCEAILSIGYFERAGQGWRLYRLWPRVFEGGHDGKLDDIDVIDVGQPNPTVAIYSGDAGDGCFVDFMSLVELMPQGPVLRIPLAPMGSDDGAASLDPASHVSFDAAILSSKQSPGLQIRYRGFVEHGAAVDETVRYSGQGRRWSARPAPFLHGCGTWWRQRFR